MKICGLQKLTALDYPGKLACTVFTPGCDLRCGFCHNAALVTAGVMPAELDMEEFFAFLEKRRGMLDGVCVTGGEPLLQEGLGDFLERIKYLGFLIKLDTNGCHPSELEKVLPLVDYVAMDIKNSPAKYELTCGTLIDIKLVEHSMELLKNVSAAYEFRTTVVDPIHDLEDIRAMGRWIRGAEKWYLQQFVDSGGLISGGLRPHSRGFMSAALEIAREYVPNVQLRGI